MRGFRIAPLLALALLALPACSPIGAAVGGVAIVGVAGAEERGIGGTAKDVTIRVEINDLWFKRDFAMYNALNLQVYEGRVLVSGALTDQALKDDALKLAWQPPGVREVIDEVELREAGGVEDFARDNWIVTQLKAKMLFDAEIFSINYSLEATGGTVYVIGLAQDQVELDRVLALARTTSYVRKVVNYALIKGDTRRKV
jgi:osmotically-inducible protein OsmY